MHVDVSDKIEAILEHGNVQVGLALAVLGKRGPPTAELIDSPIARMNLYHGLRKGALSAAAMSLLRDLLKIIMRFSEHELLLAERANEQVPLAREVYELCWEAIIRLRSL